MKSITWLGICLVSLCIRKSLQSTENVMADNGIINGLRVIYNSYKNCENQDDMILCLKGRALKLVDRAIHSDEITLLDGAALVRKPGDERSLNDNTVDSEPMPAEPSVREKRIDALLWNKIGAFFQTHSLQLHVPRLVATSRRIIEDTFAVDDDEEGRGKKKKNMGPIIIAVMMKGFMMAMALKGLAVLAGKAFIVSKLALVLAGIVALKKLLGGGGGGEKTTYEIVKQPIVSHAHQYSTSHEYSGGGGHNDWSGGHSSGSGGGYGRSLHENVPYPHLLAYRGQIPSSNENNSEVVDQGTNQKSS